MKRAFSVVSVCALMLGGATASLAQNDTEKSGVIPVLHQNLDAPRILNDYPWVKDGEASSSCNAAAHRKSEGRCT